MLMCMIHCYDLVNQVSTRFANLLNCETLGLGLSLDQFYGPGLGLEAETKIISVSDSVSILRL